MGGKPTRGAVDNYYFHSGDHVNRVAEGFIFLRKSGRIDASKLLVRPLTETMFRVVAIQKKNPELFYRIAYSETIGEAQGIAERKKTLAAMLANVAELGAERMEETIGKASLRDATIGTGVAVDKMLALTGQLPSVQIANLVMPTAEERAQRQAVHDRLDAIARRLADTHVPEA
jgi:hypothetical protein